jgi:uncharacterized protein (TIGR00297 family)
LPVGGFGGYTGVIMELTGTGLRLALALGINAAVALATYFGRLVSRSGAIGGFVLGALIYFFTDWRGYAILVGFFVLGTLVTKVKYGEKAKKGIAQEEEGRRGAKHAVANCSASLLLGIGAYFAAPSSPAGATLLMVGFTGAFATALSDTSSTEIGQAYGRRAVLLTAFRRVPPGTEGAVSLEGTAAGIAASLVLALLGLLVGLAPGWQGVLAVVVAAFGGNTLESIIGSTLERLPIVTNEVTNFLNTVIGALIAIGLYATIA